MSPTSEFVVRSILTGVGATITMDLWGAVLRRLGIPSLDFALLGRFVAHVPRGRWFHENIAHTRAVRGELVIGWGAHYAIGISFAALLLLMFGLEWGRAPTLVPAIFIGVVTVVAPWLVLQPALGAGIASSKTKAPLFNSLKSLTTHTVFGLGLFIAAQTTVSLISAGR
jgi:hypothetical protein